MNVIKKKWKELVYSMSTEDHYAEFDPNEPGNFNMARRANQGSGGIGASRVHLTSTDGFGDEEMNIGVEDDNNDISIDEYGTTDKEGVSEVMLAWRHIESWTTQHSPDLNASFGDPCTENDITHAEEDLEITFPAAVKVSLRIHDGQEDLESMTGVSGLIYGLQLMTLDQIVEMTGKWRSVARNMNKKPLVSSPIINQNQSSSGSSTPSPDEMKRRQFKLSHIPTQNCIPKGTIQPVYAHPAWIPLVTDHAGNHIGVDLAPAEAGKYAQVIIFGRDFDTKYVVAENWGDFLLSFANDLEAGNWYLIDDSDDFLAGDGDLVFRDKKSNGPAQDYLEILKKRVWLKSQDLKGENSVTMTKKAIRSSTESESVKNQSLVEETDYSTPKKVNSLEQMENQVDDAITNSEAKSKDLKIPAMEVTNDELDTKDSTGATPEEVSIGENKEEASEDLGPIGNKEETQKDLANSLEEKLKISEDENPNLENDAQEQSHEETSNKKGDPVDQIDSENVTKGARKEEFESVAL
ncbi:hypothetical protein HG535_0E01180 [Zygotorulaspora mrakii]|uniref:Knr4/Smi1-like domain-containing protein n=1 Tax=Zygotorulaspora mrakii TaxID=42260 RepID=A0A7H9B3Q4_ZYGMR|nr:uncharacterized protein HG535_0E01180 [Zygotorulaspora mrakii]QLG73034.1 hypothetical protein HG535_0E01180 [Zygotorulaspora mrakii]